MSNIIFRASKILVASLLLSASFLLSGHSTLSQTTPYYDQETLDDCMLSPDPDLCLRTKAENQWKEVDPLSLLTLNTEQVGLSGPVSFNAKYDSELAWIFGLNYVQLFNDNFGLSTKFTFGLNELRANITGGYKITPNQQIKLTYEYLQQNLPFDFESGEVESWVSQYALGGAYQYMVRHKILDSIELSAYMIRADSQELSTVVFDQTDSDYATDARRIAGGKEDNVLATFNLFPFENTALSVGGGYSRLIYDTVYEDNQKRSQPAYKVELTHILNPKLQAKAAVNSTASSTDTSAELSHILGKNLEVSLKAEYSQGNAGQPDAKSIMLGVSYPAPKEYKLNRSNTLQEFKSWLQKPVVFATRVLAIKDELVKRYQFSQKADIPDQFKQIGESINEVPTAPYFSTGDADMKVTYSVTAVKTSGLSAQSGDTDYAKLLNLEIVPIDSKSAVLKSSAPIPLDSELVGVYTITIAAIGVRPGLTKPMNASANFTLTVNSPAPVWTAANLPAASMGSTYQQSLAPADNPNEYVYTPGYPSDTYEFQLLNNGGQDWLTLDAQGNLASTGNVPTNAPANFSISVRAYSQEFKNTYSDKTFSVNVQQAPAVWDQGKAYTYTITYDQLGNILPEALNAYLSSGVTDLNILFDNGSNKNGNWEIKNNGGQFSLIKNGDPQNATQVVLTLVATNSTSSSESAQAFTFNIKPGDPQWTDADLAQAPVNAGASVSYSLNQLGLLVTPGAEDTYTFGADNLPAGWTLSGNVLSNSNVPYQENGIEITLSAVSDATGSNPVPNKGHANSDGTKTFTINVAPLVPNWTADQLSPNVVSAGDPGPTYNLNNPRLLETPGINQDTYQFKTPEGQSLPTGWALQNNGTTLVYTAGNIPANVDNYQITLIAVSAGNHLESSAQTFVIDVQQSPPVWIAGAVLQPQHITAGAPVGTYAYDLNANNGVDLLTTPGFQAPTKDSYVFTAPKGLPKGWKLSNPKNGGFLTLTNTETVDGSVGQYNITLLATSQTNGLSTTEENTFVLQIDQQAPEWTNVVRLPDGEVNQAYDQNLNHLPAALLTTAGISNDTYNFTLKNASGGGNWRIENNHLINDGASEAGTVTIDMSATSATNGLAANNPAIKSFTVEINQGDVPVWDGQPVGSMLFDDQQNGLQLTPKYLTESGTNFSIAIDSSKTPSNFDANNWQVIKKGDGNWYLLRKAVDNTIASTEIGKGNIEVPLVATNDAGNNANSASIVVLANSQVTFEWSASNAPEFLSILALPNAQDATQTTALPFATGVNPIIHTYSGTGNSKLLVVDADQSPNDYDASMTLALASTQYPWLTASGNDSGSFQLNIGYPSTAGEYSWAVNVLSSKAAGNSPANQSVNNLYSFNAQANASIQTQWTSNTLTQNAVDSGAAVSINLTTNDGGSALLETLNLPFNDTYQFTEVSSTSGDWKIVKDANNNYLLTNSSVKYTNGSEQIVLKAKSNATQQTPAANINGAGSDGSKAFTLVINALSPVWTNVGTLPDAVNGDAYAVNLNTLTASLLTTPGVENDTYDFTLVNAPEGWSIDADNQTLKSDNPGAAQTITIKLSATSRGNGQTSNNPVAKDFTLRILPAGAPEWLALPTGDIKFDELNIDNAIRISGTEADGTAQNGYIQSSDDLTITFGNTGSNFISSNWELRKVPNNDWYLIRKASTGPDARVAIDYSEAGETVLVPLVAENDVAASNANAGVQVKTDPSLIFKWSPASEPGILQIDSLSNPPSQLQSEVIPFDEGDPGFPVYAYTVNDVPVYDSKQNTYYDAGMTFELEKSQYNYAWLNTRNSTANDFTLEIGYPSAPGDYPWAANVTSSKAAGSGIKTSVQNLWSFKATSNLNTPYWTTQVLHSPIQANTAVAFDLNNNTAGALAETPDVQDDQYTYQLISPTPAEGWYMAGGADNTHGTILKNDKVSYNAGQVKIVLAATSISNNQATHGGTGPFNDPDEYQKVFTVAIEQSAPIWTEAPTGSLKFDDTTSGIQLTPNFIEADADPNFAIMVDTSGAFDGTNWKVIKKNGNWYLVRQEMNAQNAAGKMVKAIDSKEIGAGALDIPLIAVNAGGYSATSSSVTVNPDSNLSFSWSPQTAPEFLNIESLNPLDPNIVQKNTVAFDTNNPGYPVEGHSPTGALVVDTSRLAPIYYDPDMTFALGTNSPAWLSATGSAASQFTLNIGYPNAAGNYTWNANVTSSKASGAVSVGITNLYPFVATPNTSKAEWTANNIEIQVNGGQTNVSYDLSDSELVNNPEIDWDKYTFAIVELGTTQGWYIDTDGHTLKNDDVAFETSQTIVLSATSQANGELATSGTGPFADQNQTQKIFTISVTMLAPAWDNAPTGSIKFDDKTNGIQLTPNFIQTHNDPKFTIAIDTKATNSTFDNKNWSVFKNAENGEWYLVRNVTTALDAHNQTVNAMDAKEVGGGAVNVPLIANNSSETSVSSTSAITVAPDNQLSFSWSPSMSPDFLNIDALVNPNTTVTQKNVIAFDGNNPGYPIQSYTPAGELVIDTNAARPYFYDPNMTFSLAENTPTWLSATGSNSMNFTLNIGYPSTPGNYEWYTNVTDSKASGAVNTPIDNLYPFVATQNTTTAQWTANNIDIQVNGGQTNVSYDLSTNDSGLLVNNTALPWDTYTFAVIGSGSTSGWYIDADGHTLKNDSVLFESSQTIVLTATSVATEQLANNGSGTFADPAKTQKIFTITVTQKAPVWDDTPVGSLTFDDKTNGVQLTPGFIQSNGDPNFSITINKNAGGTGFNINNWNVIKNTNNQEWYLVRKTTMTTDANNHSVVAMDSQEIGAGVINVPLIATNSSTTSATQSSEITVTEHNQLTFSWSPESAPDFLNIDSLENPNTSIVQKNIIAFDINSPGYPVQSYTLAGELVIDSGRASDNQPLYYDASMSLSLADNSYNWLTTSGSNANDFTLHISYPNAENNYPWKTSVTNSKASGPINMPVENLYPFIATLDTSSAQWTAKNVDIQVYSGQTNVSYDLNKNTSGALVSNAALPWDTYTFSVIESGSTSGWYVDTDGHTLRNDNVLFEVSQTIVLTAQSIANLQLATGGTGSFSDAEKTQKIFTITVTQLAPQWDNAPTGSLKFDDKSNGIQLTPNFIQSNGDPNFSISINKNGSGAGFDPNNWDVIKNIDNQEWYLVRKVTTSVDANGDNVNSMDAKEVGIGAVNVPLLAKNSSTTTASSTSSITVAPDNQLAFSWSPKTQPDFLNIDSVQNPNTTIVQKNIIAFDTKNPGYPIQSYTPAGELVIDSGRSSAAYYDPNMSISLGENGYTWLTTSGSNANDFVLNVGYPSSAGSYEWTTSVTSSKASGAVNTNVNNLYPFIATQNTSTAEWTANTIDLSVTAGDTNVSYDLSKTENPKLVNNAALQWDSYTFNIKTGTTDGWYIDTDGHTLKNDNVQFVAEQEIVITATSLATSKLATSGTGPFADAPETQKIFTINVTIPAPAWNDTPTGNLKFDDTVTGVQLTPTFINNNGDPNFKIALDTTSGFDASNWEVIQNQTDNEWYLVRKIIKDVDDANGQKVNAIDAKEVGGEPVNIPLVASNSSSTTAKKASSITVNSDNQLSFKWSPLSRPSAFNIDAVINPDAAVVQKNLIAFDINSNGYAVQSYTPTGLLVIDSESSTPYFDSSMTFTLTSVDFEWLYANDNSADQFTLEVGYPNAAGTYEWASNVTNSKASGSVNTPIKNLYAFVATLNSSAAQWTSNTINLDIIAGQQVIYDLAKNEAGGGVLVNNDSLSWDSYTFKVETGTTTGWYIDTDGHTLKNNSVEFLTDQEIIISATSMATTQKATAGSGTFADQAKTQKIFTISVNIAAPAWSDNALTGNIKFDEKVDGVQLTPTFIQSNNDPNFKIVVDANGSGNNFVPNNWQVIQSSLNSEWYLVRKTIQATDANGVNVNAMDAKEVGNGTVNVPLIASNSSPTTANKNSAITVTPDNQLTFDWSPKTAPEFLNIDSLANPPSGVFQENVLSFDANYPVQSYTPAGELVVDTTETTQSYYDPNMTFQLASESPTWLSTTGSNANDFTLNVGYPTASGTYAWVANVITSKASGSVNKPINIAYPFIAKEMPAPVWVCAPQGSIKFDQTTPGTDSIRLSGANPGTDGSCVASSPSLNLSISGGSNGYIAANWDVQKNNGDWYLVRKADTIAIPNTIDSAEVGASAVNVELNANNGVGTASASKTAAATVLPNANLTFRWDGGDSLGQPYNIMAAQPAQKLTQSQAQFMFAYNVSTYSGTLQVIDTSNSVSPAAYTVSHYAFDNPDALDWMAFIENVDASGKTAKASLNIGYPTQTGTYGNWSIKVIQSKGTGSIPGTVLQNVPSFLATGTSIIPTPSINQTYGCYSGQNSVPCNNQPLANRAVTALQITGLDDSKNYGLSDFGVNFNPANWSPVATPMKKMCPGPVDIVAKNVGTSSGSDCLDGPGVNLDANPTSTIQPKNGSIVIYVSITGTVQCINGKNCQGQYPAYVTPYPVVTQE